MAYSDLDSPYVVRAPSCSSLLPLHSDGFDVVALARPSCCALASQFVGLSVGACSAGSISIALAPCTGVVPGRVFRQRPDRARLGASPYPFWLPSRQCGLACLCICLRIDLLPLRMAPLSQPVPLPCRCLRFCLVIAAVSMLSASLPPAIASPDYRAAHHPRLLVSLCVAISVSIYSSGVHGLRLAQVLREAQRAAVGARAQTRAAQGLLALSRSSLVLKLLRFMLCSVCVPSQCGCLSAMCPSGALSVLVLQSQSHETCVSTVSQFVLGLDYLHSNFLGKSSGYCVMAS